LYKKIFPIALFFAFSLVFSNYAYVYLSVAYIQVLRALYCDLTPHAGIDVCNNICGGRC